MQIIKKRFKTVVYKLKNGMKGSPVDFVLWHHFELIVEIQVDPIAPIKLHQIFMEQFVGVCTS